MLCFLCLVFFKLHIVIFSQVKCTGVLFIEINRGIDGICIYQQIAWGSLLGLQLAERDIIVACVDYRNFPQGTISDMVKDVSQGISFVCNIIGEYGGDPNRIYLMGQSAGAHVSACVLLEQAIRESRGKNTS
ncbi:Alpha/beta-Hydrolases superfamily protein [Theobroma cacao]|uniref:protein-S-isoprenylcysteine alpha-carbonyl methylesterase n=1 Tax=Theobroma cacao TaxID=3641 RepID=S1SMY1_THECC|nr:Alpha/beta-Hydrolases superfamily protein [Theobroma cacao]